MSYFSSKATWLSLLEDIPATVKDTDWIPGAPHSENMEIFAGADQSDWAGDPCAESENCDNLEQLVELRHNLFFHQKEWEYGPQLIRDNLTLARKQSDKEEALAYYCRARQVAESLTTEHRLTKALMAWLEIDLIICEIHQLMDQYESSDTYAREGLGLIKANRFPSALDPEITRFAIRFFRLLQRQ